jgi:pimeloyl-ACP methyl ester carboxylesterase
VLYLLPNFNCCQWRYTGGNFQGFHLKESMDGQIANGEVQEMIVVIPNAVHFLGGSWYRNSPLTGNWEDFIVRDVVEFLDSHYRTIRSAEGRALAGHGMGGTGALELGMKHPDVFTCVFAMSPALFDQNGLRDIGILGQEPLRKWHENVRSWAAMEPASARRAFRDYVQPRLNSPSRALFFEGLFVSYGAAVAPDLSLAYPHISFPVESSGKLDTNLVARFENGFGGWPEKVKGYLGRGVALRSITIEYGTGDEYPWIRRGADYLTDLMHQAGIQSTLRRDEGGHESALGRRLERAMLPAVSQALRGNP